MLHRASTAIHLLRCELLSEYGSMIINTEHLLLGILRENPNVMVCSRRADFLINAFCVTFRKLTDPSLTWTSRDPAILGEAEGLDACPPDRDLRRPSEGARLLFVHELQRDVVPFPFAVLAALFLSRAFAP